MSYRYRDEVLRALEAHGLRPRATTPPSVVRDYLNDLYRYELRALRERLSRGEFPKSAYAARVDAVRRRYPLLAHPLALWVHDGPVPAAHRRC